MRALFFAAVVLSGCGSTVISAKGLSTACTADTDCVGVFIGDACSTCTCPTTAIATSSKAAYDSEAKAASAWCGARPAIACECPRFTVSCVSNACTLSVP